MKWAIPLSFQSIRALNYSALFVSLCRTSRQFVALSNTHIPITRENGTPPPRTPNKIRPQALRGEASIHYNFLLGPFLHAGVGIRMCGLSQEQVLRC